MGHIARFSPSLGGATGGKDPNAEDRARYNRSIDKADARAEAIYQTMLDPNSPAYQSAIQELVTKRGFDPARAEMMIQGWIQQQLNNRAWAGAANANR